MMDRNLDYLLNEYRERIAMLTDAMARGNVQSYEEYKYTCGQIRGLESACLTITDLKQRMEHSDDE
jgi:hypothetical protein